MIPVRPRAVAEGSLLESEASLGIAVSPPTTLLCILWVLGVSVICSGVARVNEVLPVVKSGLPAT